MAKKGRVKVTVAEKDLGFADFTRKIALLRRESGSHVKVGVLEGGAGDEVRDGGLTNAEIAAIHEFGAPNAGIPERSFIRSTFDLARPELEALMGKLLRCILDGAMNPQEALDLAGMWFADRIKQRITSGAGIPPPNAPSTIARKGSDRPLVDSGRMVDIITWAVVRAK